MANFPAAAIPRSWSRKPRGSAPSSPNTRDWATVSVPSGEHKAQGTAMDVVVSQVSKTWGSGTSAVPALDQVSHVFGSRRLTCILGPSGCGKSTLIQIIGGLETATGGHIQVRDPARSNISRALGADSVIVWQK